MTSQRAVITSAGTPSASIMRTRVGVTSAERAATGGAGRCWTSANRYSRSSAVIRSVEQTRSSTSADTWILRPCSSHVYQVTLTPASAATSSRRNPGVRRRWVSGNPTSVGESRARQPLRKSIRGRRWVSIVRSSSHLLSLGRKDRRGRRAGTEAPRTPARGRGRIPRPAESLEAHWLRGLSAARGLLRRPGAPPELPRSLRGRRCGKPATGGVAQGPSDAAAAGRSEVLRVLDAPALGLRLPHERVSELLVVLLVERVLRPERHVPVLALEADA